VPATEAQGRIHTSACTVAILPELDEVEDVALNPAELRVDTYRSSGAGGQHVNKTDSAIRITHLPTGIVVECQDERSQHKNRSRALSLLRARLLEAEQQKQAAAQARIERPRERGAAEAREEGAPQAAQRQRDHGNRIALNDPPHARLERIELAGVGDPPFREDADEVPQCPLMHDEQCGRPRHSLFSRLARGGFSFGGCGARFLRLDVVALDGHRLGVPDVLVVFADGAVR